MTEFFSRTLDIPDTYLLGRAILRLKTAEGAAEVLADKSLFNQIGDQTEFLSTLCLLHGYARYYTQADKKDFPSLIIVLDDFVINGAAASANQINVNRESFADIISTAKLRRVSNVLVHELGHVVQHYMRLLQKKEVVVWPSFVEGTADLIGFRICQSAYLLPAGYYDAKIIEAKTQAELAPPFIAAGIQALADGGSGHEGMSNPGHSPAALILAAALFDLTFNHAKSPLPFDQAIQALIEKGRTDGNESTPISLPQNALERFEIFIEAFARTAGFNPCAYLQLWKFQFDALPDKLAHLPPLEARLPAVGASLSAANTMNGDERLKRRQLQAAFSQVGVDSITVSLGSEIAAHLLVKEKQDSVLDCFSDVRFEIARETGIVISGMCIRDDIFLDPLGYAIHVRERPAGSGALRVNAILAVGNDSVLAQLDGEAVQEPVYGLSGKWIAEADTELARDAGAMVSTVINTLTSHVGQVARDNLAELFGYQELEGLLTHLNTTSPVLVKELRATYSMSAMLESLRILLREQVWPRDSIAAFEAMLHSAATDNDPMIVAARMRERLLPARLRALKMRPLEICEFEAAFESETVIPWLLAAPRRDPAITEHIADRFTDYLAFTSRRNGFAVTASRFGRQQLAEFVKSRGLKIEIFARDEFPPDFALRTVWTIYRP